MSFTCFLFSLHLCLLYFFVKKHSCQEIASVAMALNSSFTLTGYCTKPAIATWHHNWVHKYPGCFKRRPGLVYLFTPLHWVMNVSFLYTCIRSWVLMILQSSLHKHGDLLKFLLTPKNSSSSWWSCCLIRPSLWARLSHNCWENSWGWITYSFLGRQLEDFSLFRN